MTKDNNLLGRFQLEGIPPAPRGVPKIDVSFDIDANGILHITAKDQGSGRSADIRITNNRDRLSKEEIERMVAEAELHKEDDQKQKQKIDAKNGLESYVFACKQAVNDADQSRVSAEDKEKVVHKCDAVMEWLDNNSLADLDEIEQMRKELESVCSPLTSFARQGFFGSWPHRVALGRFATVSAAGRVQALATPRRRSWSP